MSGAYFCTQHEYIGTDPCGVCKGVDGVLVPPPAPVVLNGERVLFHIETKKKPWGWPWWLWNRLCRFVIRNTQITVETKVRKAE